MKLDFFLWNPATPFPLKNPLSLSLHPLHFDISEQLFPFDIQSQQHTSLRKHVRSRCQCQLVLTFHYIFLLVSDIDYILFCLTWSTERGRRWLVLWYDRTRDPFQVQKWQNTGDAPILKNPLTTGDTFSEKRRLLLTLFHLAMNPKHGCRYLLLNSSGEWVTYHR